MWQDKRADIKIKLNKLQEGQRKREKEWERGRQRPGAHDKVLIVNNFYAFDPREWQYFLRQLIANESKRSSKRNRGNEDDGEGETEGKRHQSAV